MADKDLQMQRKKSDGTFDKYYPKTKTHLVVDDTTGQTIKEQYYNIVNDYIRSPGYGITTGSANAYTLILTPSLTSYTAGVCVAIKIHAANTGASTININGLGAKSIKDSKGNNLTSEKLVLNSIYTLRYDGTNFILQGEGGEYGTATASDVLSGKTIGTDNGLITGNIPIGVPMQEAAGMAISGVGNLFLAPQRGYYDGATSTSAYSPNFVPQNIKTGVNIFGCSGTFTSDANAVAGEILSGKTAYVNGNKIAGTIPIAVSGQECVGSAVSGIGNLFLAPARGYYNGLDSTMIYSPNFLPSNIKSGVNIFGVVGTLATLPAITPQQIVCDTDSQYIHRVLSNEGTLYNDVATLNLSAIFFMLKFGDNYNNTNGIIKATTDIYIANGGSYIKLLAGQTYEQGDRFRIYNPQKGVVTLTNKAGAVYRAINYAIYIN